MKERNSGGRPTKLTPELIGKITSAIRSGAYMETAAAYAGVHKDTLYDWLKRGARDREAGVKRSLFTVFSDAIEKALADTEIMDLLTVKKASARHWQAAAWRLERRFPDRWGRRKLELSGPNGGPIQNQDVPREATVEQLTGMLDRGEITEDDLDRFCRVNDLLAAHGESE